jgi:hypothetical protein
LGFQDLSLFEKRNRGCILSLKINRAVCSALFQASGEHILQYRSLRMSKNKTTSVEIHDKVEYKLFCDSVENCKLRLMKE